MDASYFNVEIIGWIGSTFVLFSFMFDGWKMRVLNGIGAAMWLGYGLIQGSLSLAFLNGIIICIHIFKVIQNSNKL